MTTTLRLAGFLFTLTLSCSSSLYAQDSGLSLDQLMSGSSSSRPAPAQTTTTPSPQGTAASGSVQENGLSLDGLLAPSQQTRSALDASLDLGTIEEGRRLATLRDASDSLAGLDRRINQSCSCTRSSCFDLRNINISQQAVIDAATEAETKLNEQKVSVCQSWQGVGQPGQDLAAVETRITMANRILDALGQIDNSADEVAGNLEQQDAEIRYAIAQQQEEQSGFNWGQFTAMTVGVVAGGIGNLDPNAQAEIMSSIIADSFDGGGSMSNFESTMDSLNADLATMQNSFDTSLGDSGYNTGGITVPSYSGNGLGGLDSLMPGSGGMGSGSSAGFDPSMAPSSTGNARSSTPGAAPGSSGVIQETYSFTCPSGTQANIPIVADSPACASAMRNYAKVMSCNLIDEMESAQRQYESACAAEIY